MIRHFVASNRLITPVKVDGMADQYWYSCDDNSPADKASRFMRCGRYVDNNGTIAAPSFFAPGDEDTDYLNAVEDYKASGSSLEMFRTLFSELETERKDLVIFNFGYQNKLNREFEQLKYVHDKYIMAPGSNLGRVLMITWPSQGFGGYDVETGNQGFFQRTFGKWFRSGKKQKEIEFDTKVTGEALAVFLLKLADFKRSRYADAPADVYRPKIHFIAQSMANRILLYCFERLDAIGKMEKVSGLLDTLMLTAADVENTVFENEIHRSGLGIARRVFIVCSDQDVILKASDVFHNIRNTRRLGITGPSAATNIPDNLYIMKIRQSKISFDPPDHNHRYFAYNQKVIDRYLFVFNSGVTERTDLVNA